jgi:acyl carrier protein
MTSPVVERITNIISEQLAVHKESVVPDAEIEKDLWADSLDAVELVMALEEEFEIEIPDTEAEKCKTVQDIINTIDSIIRGITPIHTVSGVVIDSVKLPLPSSAERCLGHLRSSHAESCPSRDRCARHMTMSHKNEPWDKTNPPFYTLCKNTNLIPNFIGIEE